ncbi:amino acid ABC transporter, amino acid-binding/permease [Enterococcus sp. 10A9_DIV0425]|uniref:Amino acid ABC transporter, amino acid-binding/permease n=1 Tax=Candidatus Enterococcus wittei TaxID=1987383 RepID=A0A2C9XNU5_9ENTE|nr:amino acid ABC transporter permease [Enterococcus sp. 10A9_DIV0425]OTP11850.1 amino acid ABC transporter, amino acid-binding/permease [Enterococcus sp. 10A9_DIV0425]THE10543.1 amino acid ABC transporter permease [Enterococcus hirae]
MYFPSIDFSLMWSSLPFVLGGLGYTLGIGVVSFLLGNIIGLILTILGLVKWKPLQLVIRFYLSFFRGVPALVLLFLLYFGLPYQLNAITAAVICFTITSSAFIGEIYRGSLEGVNQGQWDAGKASGFSFLGVLRFIVLPQAFRISIPALSNVAMDLVKGTSLAATITVPEIFQKAKIVGGRTFDYFSLYILVALLYWLICIGIEQLQKYLEYRFNQQKRIS